MELDSVCSVTGMIGTRGKGIKERRIIEIKIIIDGQGKGERQR